MEESIAAYTIDLAPGDKVAEWHQRSLKHVIEEWGETRPDDYEVAVTKTAFGGAVGYYVRAGDVGPNGSRTEIHFAPNLDPEFLEDDFDDPETLCEDFYEDWVAELQDVIAADQEHSLFTPKEFAAFFAWRHPREKEYEAADALEISVGNYRGKVGSVKEKLVTARSTIELDEIAPESVSREEWWGEQPNAPLTVLDRIDERRLPVDAAQRVQVGNIHNYDLEDLLL